MEYILSDHARKRIAERSITKQQVESALRYPTKVLYDNKGRLMFKKLYLRKSSQRLLIVVGEKQFSKLKIITVIDTSKVRKYL